MMMIASKSTHKVLIGPGLSRRHLPWVPHAGTEPEATELGSNFLNTQPCMHISKKREKQKSSVFDHKSALIKNEISKQLNDIGNLIYHN